MDRSQILKAELWGEGMLSPKDKYHLISLKHIPVMITNNQEVLCIPDYSEGFHIGITGMSSKGKGILGQTFLDFEYNMKKIPSLILNDFQTETFENSLPCTNQVFLNNNRLINSKPYGLPIVYVFPSHKKLHIDETKKLFPHIKMSIPSRAVIMSIENYFKLDKSAKYFSAYINEFLECKTMDDVKNALKKMINENVLDQKNRSSLENMAFKIETIFKNIFNEGFTDNSAQDSHAILNVRAKGLESYYDNEGYYNNFTIQSLMAIGLIPSIQTSEIKSKPWFSAYMSFIVSSIYEDKIKDPYFKDKFIRLYIPEIDKLGRGENGKLINSELNLIGTNGRTIGISILWDAQDYNNVDDDIKANTSYLFVLRKANSDEVKGIRADWGEANKEMEKVILNLETNARRGEFPCVAFTNREFVLCDLRTGKSRRTSRPQVGKLLTPLSQHRNPGVPLKQMIRGLI